MPEPEPTTIDMKETKSEAEWLAASDRFWIAVTPKLFEWLRWTITLAAMTFVATKSGSPMLKVFVGLCYGSSMLYWMAFFSQFKFVNFPLLRGVRARRFASIAISSTLAVGTYLLVTHAINAIIIAKP